MLKISDGLIGILVVSLLFSIELSISIGSVEWTKPNADDCDVNNSSSCGPDQCCVYQVFIRRNPKSARKRIFFYQRCQHLRYENDLCITKPESFMCPCRSGLLCVSDEKDDFGHCKPQII